MELTEVQFGSQPPVDGYGPGFFRVEGKVIEASLLILPTGIFMWEGLDALGQISDHAGEIDLLLIGMGADIAALTPAQMKALNEFPIQYEVMGTAPAARTYNVLLSEGRRIGAALLTV